MPRFIQVFDRFDKGDWGDIGEFRAGRLEPGYFRANNMVVYQDGSIGPRAGVIGRTYTSMPNGAVLAAGYSSEFGAATQERFFVVGNTLYAAPAFANGAVRTISTLAGGAPAFNTHDSYAVADNEIYLALPDSTTGGRIYRWQRGDDTVTSVATLDISPWHLTLHRDRLYACGQTPNRVYYSNAAAPATWTTATDFFDVGYAGALYALGTVGNSLHIYMENGEWMLSGVPGSTSVLRELFQGGGFSPAARGVVRTPDEGGAVWVSNARSAPVVSRAGLADRRSLIHLDAWSEGGQRVGAHDKTTSDILFVDSAGNGLLRHNGIWTRQTFGMGTSGIAHALQSQTFGIIVDGTAGTPHKFYEFTTSFSSIDRPGFVSDTAAQPGDGSTTPIDAWLYLPEQWHPQGNDQRVMAVDVDFVSWDTGTTETAHFDLTVRATRKQTVGQATSGVTTSATKTFDEPVASSSTSGTERRVRFNVGDQGWGRGYQIRLNNIRSCSIRAIGAVVDDERRDAR